LAERIFEPIADKTLTKMNIGLLGEVKGKESKDKPDINSATVMVILLPATSNIIPTMNTTIITIGILKLYDVAKRLVAPSLLKAKNSLSYSISI